MTPYQILGLNENATRQEIDTAYEERTKRYHPNAGGDAWALQQVQQAYDALRNSPTERANKPEGVEPPGFIRQPFVLPEWIHRKEVALVSTVLALLLVLVFWQWIWRIVAVGCGIGLVGAAAWLVLVERTSGKYPRALTIGSGIAAGFAALWLIWIAISAGGPAFISVNYLDKTSPALIVTLDERESSDLSLLGSALVHNADSQKLRLYTNSHVLGLQEVAEKATRQRDRTANLTGFSAVVQFPSGKRKAVQRIAIAADPALDVACVEVSAEGLVAGQDFIVVPAITNALETLTVKSGDAVVAVGTPYALELANSPTYGRISSLRFQRNDPSSPKWIQHDATITGGNSGGPLFLIRGNRAHWVGVNTRGLPGTTMSFAISVDDVTSAEFRWANASPSGAAELVELVYGVPAASGNQSPRLGQAKSPASLPKEIGQTPHSTKDVFVVKKPNVLAFLFWPITTNAPYINPRAIFTWFLIFQVLRGIGRSSIGQQVEQVSQAGTESITESSQSRTGWGEKACPRCKTKSYTMYSVGRCPKCGQSTTT